MALANGDDLLLPIGFRFDPTDRELVGYYLTGRFLNLPLPTHMFEFDVFQTEPWRLPTDDRYCFEHRKYYFFDIMNRRFENMEARPAGNGEWRMVESNEDLALSHNQLIVRKNTFVYWRKEGNQVLMTEWWMHEFFIISTHFHPARETTLGAYRIFKA